MICYPPAGVRFQLSDRKQRLAKMHDWNATKSSRGPRTETYMTAALMRRTHHTPRYFPLRSRAEALLTSSSIEDASGSEFSACFKGLSAEQIAQHVAVLGANSRCTESATGSVTIARPPLIRGGRRKQGQASQKQRMRPFNPALAKLAYRNLG